jgi:Holliday junction resolvasome RuvABC endonuclease subunit
MNVLVLDPAASTGFCLVNINDDSATIYQTGFIDAVTSKSIYQGDHCISLMEKVEDLILKHEIKHIAIEDYFFSSKFTTGANVNIAYRTAIHIIARKNNIPYTILNISSWKKYIAGTTNPTKEQKKCWGNEAAKKIYIQDALYKKYNIRFPNFSLSQKNGKPVKFRLDIVDAVAQAIFFCHDYYKINTIQYIVENPPDHNFTKTLTKNYVYPEK